MRNQAQAAGNRLEDKTQEALKEIESLCDARMYRYPDKKAAGVRGFAQKAPADYGLLIAGHHHRIECKASVKHGSLVDCLKTSVKDHQMTAAKKQIRAGGSYWILFASELTYSLELWNAKDLMKAYYTPRVKPNIRYAADVRKYTKQNVKEILAYLNRRVT